MTVTFFGHSELPGDKISCIKSLLRNHIKILIDNGTTQFLLGGYGKFDYICASVLSEYKERYPHIERVLVIAYIKKGTIRICMTLHGILRLKMCPKDMQFQNVIYIWWIRQIWLYATWTTPGEGLTRLWNMLNPKRRI